MSCSRTLLLCCLSLVLGAAVSGDDIVLARRVHGLALEHGDLWTCFQVEAWARRHRVEGIEAAHADSLTVHGDAWFAFPDRLHYRREWRESIKYETQGRFFRLRRAGLPLHPSIWIGRASWVISGDRSCILRLAQEEGQLIATLTELPTLEQRWRQRIDLEGETISLKGSKFLSAEGTRAVIVVRHGGRMRLLEVTADGHRWFAGGDYRLLWCGADVQQLLVKSGREVRFLDGDQELMVPMRVQLGAEWLVRMRLGGRDGIYRLRGEQAERLPIEMETPLAEVIATAEAKAAGTREPISTCDFWSNGRVLILFDAKGLRFGQERRDFLGEPIADSVVKGNGLILPLKDGLGFSAQSFAGAGICFLSHRHPLAVVTDHTNDRLLTVGGKGPAFIELNESKNRASSLYRFGSHLLCKSYGVVVALDDSYREVWRSPCRRLDILPGVPLGLLVTGTIRDPELNLLLPQPDGEPPFRTVRLMVESYAGQEGIDYVRDERGRYLVHCDHRQSWPWWVVDAAGTVLDSSTGEDGKQRPPWGSPSVGNRGQITYRHISFRLPLKKHPSPRRISDIGCLDTERLLLGDGRLWRSTAHGPELIAAVSFKEERAWRLGVHRRYSRQRFCRLKGSRGLLVCDSQRYVLGRVRRGLEYDLLPANKQRRFKGTHLGRGPLREKGLTISAPRGGQRFTWDVDKTGFEPTHLWSQGSSVFAFTPCVVLEIESAGIRHCFRPD